MSMDKNSRPKNNQKYQEDGYNLKEQLQMINIALTYYIDDPNKNDIHIFNNMNKPIEDALDMVRYYWKNIDNYTNTSNNDIHKIFLQGIFNNLNKLNILISVFEKLNTISEDDIKNNNLYNLVEELINLFVNLKTKFNISNEIISKINESKKNINAEMTFLDNVNTDTENIIKDCVKYFQDLNNIFPMMLINETNHQMKYNLILNLNILDNINNLFNNNNADYIKQQINNNTLLYSYFEPKLQSIKLELMKIKEPTPTLNELIIDMCEFVINIINTRFIPLDLKFNLKTTNDLEQFEKKDIFNNYLMEHAKIYDPSPCKPFDDMKKYIETDYWNHHKKNYEIYYFVNDKKQLYYYSIFYKIKTKYFLNPSDSKILRDLDLHQCLIMGSVFQGNEPYKYGKFLWILNKFLFPDTLVNKSKIICFVKNTKIIVDEVFDFLNKNELFNDQTGATTPATTKKGVTQNVNVDTYKCKYLKYDDVSLYTKQDEDDTYINLIVKKFEPLSLAQYNNDI
jgi:hypothetical protein